MTIETPPRLAPEEASRHLEAVRSMGYIVLRPDQVQVDVEVGDLTRLSESEWRFDASVLVPFLGRVQINRVFLHAVPDGGWALQWPRRRHDEKQMRYGTPDRTSFWVTTATMTGRYASAVLSAAVRAVENRR